MQRIEVTAEGITVTLVTEPLISMYGREMRPGATSVYALPWDEISGVSLSATEFAPDAERWVDLTVDVSWGEYFEVHEDAEGFADAVRELVPLVRAPCTRGGGLEDGRPGDLAKIPAGLSRGTGHALMGTNGSVARSCR